MVSQCKRNMLQCRTEKSPDIRAEAALCSSYVSRTARSATFLCDLINLPKTLDFFLLILYNRQRHIFNMQP